MKFITNRQKIKSQITKWNESILQPGDSLSEIIEVPIKQIFYDSAIMLNFDEELKNLPEQYQDTIEAIQNEHPLPPLLINQKNSLLDGYIQLLVCQKFSLHTVPVIKVTQLAHL